MSDGFPTRSVDLGTASQVIDWLGRLVLLYSLSKPIFNKMQKRLSKLKGISFWEGQMSSLVMLVGRNDNPAIIREEENIICLSCLTKARNNLYCLFEDKESEEIVPICATCFKEMTKCKKRGVELMTEPERKLWHLVRFALLYGEEGKKKTFDELNARDYSYKEIRKKFLRRIRFPKDAIIDNP